MHVRRAGDLALGLLHRGPVPAASPAPAGPFVTGTPVFEANGWIEYVPGDAPLIIFAPHGGRRRPFRLPDEYFTGGYNAYRHGSTKGGPIDAMQLDMPVDLIGDKPQNLQRAAGIVATALVTYLERHFGWT